MSYILSIDQGTTSSRAIVFDARGQSCGLAQQEFRQYFPQEAWVEHDPEEIWQTVVQVCKDAIEAAGLKAQDIAAIGITNQRETTLIWERSSGKVIYPAIVWQDRRTSHFCETLKKAGHEGMVAERSGLLLDPYFSASKIAWILDHVDGARVKAEAGELCFGTIDSFLLWRLTGGKQHLTDATNASRTLLFNIHQQCWDDDLLALFNVPAKMLPQVKDSSDDFGSTVPELLGAAIPICGVAGDQQAALIGQACFKEGMAKSTYGTGCFLVLNTGKQVVRSSHQLLSTVAYRINGETTYALEGSIFIAGAVVQWLRDSLKFIEHASKSETMAEQTGYESGVFLVPAFTGLGAPYWDPEARGAIFGLTRDTGINEIVTAALMSVGLQTADLLKAMEKDGAVFPKQLRIDGGMVNNNWVAQSLADLMQLTVDRPASVETTALGVAYLAGLKAGIFSSLEEIAEFWALERRFEPQLEKVRADRIYENWQRAVKRVLS